MAPIELRLTFENHVWQTLGHLDNPDMSTHITKHDNLFNFTPKFSWLSIFNILEGTGCSRERGAGSETGIRVWSRHINSQDRVWSRHINSWLRTCVSSLYDLGSVAVASSNNELGTDEQWVKASFYWEIILIFFALQVRYHRTTRHARWSTRERSPSFSPRWETKTFPPRSSRW